MWPCLRLAYYLNVIEYENNSPSGAAMCNLKRFVVASFSKFDFSEGKMRGMIVVFDGFMGIKKGRVSATPWTHEKHTLLLGEQHHFYGERRFFHCSEIFELE